MKWSTFIVGLAIALAVMIAGGVALAALNGRQSRPEGVAENWLTDVSDTTRKGVEKDARRRAEKIGSLTNAVGLVSADTDGKAAFEDIEVGKAYEDSGTWMRFRVHARRGNDSKKIDGAIMVTKADSDRWHIGRVLVGRQLALNAALLETLPKLPSEGGPPPSSAPMSLWIGGLVGAAIIGVITTSLVRLAGRPAAAAVTA